MKKESKHLYTKAVNSLVLSVEHFNRPSDRARVEAVLIFLDHAFEMLLKSAILHRKGKIRDSRAKQTIGFDACVSRALSDGQVQFITREQALTLQAINSLRDAAQHHLLDISEQHLYLQAQSGVTLFRDLVKKVFGLEIQKELPSRVLPLSTAPPTDFEALFDNEVKDIKKLLQPGRRKSLEAKSKIRSLAILESAVQGEKLQPSQSDLNKISNEIKKGFSWDKIFPGVASINITSQGYGPSFDLRISKKEGIPIVLVPAGTPGASVVAIKRVDDLGFYNLGRDQLAQQVGLSGPKTTAIIRHLSLQSDQECFKEFKIGKTKFNRYSQKAIEKIKQELPSVNMAQIWNKYGDFLKKKQLFN